MFSKSTLVKDESSVDPRVHKFMMEGVYKVSPEKTEASTKFSAMFENLRTFKKIEGDSTTTTGGMIPKGAIEASVENEGVMFGDKPVYRIAQFGRSAHVSSSSSLKTSSPDTFDPFRGPAVHRGPKPSTQTKNQPSQPPHVPSIYDLERLGHFFTNEDHFALKSKIENEFKNTRADFEFDSSKWKWDVYAYDKEDRNQCCHVAVRLFRSYDKKDKARGNTIVEFHKRKGCGWMYHRWFAPLFNKLVEAHIAAKGTEKLRCCSKMKMPECFNKDVELKSSDLMPLLGMAKAHCSAVQAEAFREIASLGQRDQKCHAFILQTDIVKGQNSMSQNGILGTIRDVLRNDVDVDVSRCAASTLRVLCESGETRRIFREANETKSLVESLCGYLKKPKRHQKLSEKQTRRECVQALRCLRPDLGASKDLDRVLIEFQDLKL